MPAPISVWAYELRRIRSPDLRGREQQFRFTADLFLHIDGSADPRELRTGVARGSTIGSRP